MNLVDIDVSFEGKSKRQELDAVLAMVKNLVEKNRAGWDCPLEGPISQCEAVKHWTELATALPFSETDVILGGHHFHLPAPKQFVPPPKDMVSEDVVSGVNRATMQLELDLPHSTFMNVDDGAVDYEAAMIAKQKAVIASRKRAAEKLLANSASGKRALVASKQGNVSGHARGYGARQTSSNAQGDPNDGENAEKDDVVEDKGKDGEDDKDYRLRLPGSIDEIGPNMKRGGCWLPPFHCTTQHASQHGTLHCTALFTAQRTSLHVPHHCTCPLPSNPELQPRQARAKTTASWHAASLPFPLWLV